MIYLVQGIIFGDSSNVGAILLLLIMLMSMFIAVKVVRTYRLPLFMKALNVLMLMFTIYGITYILNGQSIYQPQPIYIYLKNV